METLEDTYLLSKYSDWSYTNAFSMSENEIVFFPHVSIYGEGKGSISFTGHQILFWLKIKDIFGHYFLKEKQLSDTITDFISNDSEFKFGDFKVYTIKSSKNRLQILTMLKPYETLTNVEIEIHNDNLFIKTTDGPTVSGFEALFNTIKKTIFDSNQNNPNRF